MIDDSPNQTPMPKNNRIQNCINRLHGMHTFRHHLHGEHVADLQLGLATAVHELASVHTLSSNERLVHGLVPVRMSERG
jgi:hypothetical protein